MVYKTKILFRINLKYFFFTGREYALTVVNVLEGVILYDMEIRVRHFKGGEGNVLQGCKSVMRQTSSCDHITQVQRLQSEKW